MRCPNVPRMNAQPAADAPRFSVVIPTIGREPGLAAALEALGRQSFPRERFEILVAFDGVPPSPAAQRACAEAGARVASLERRGGPGAARNAAAALARGEILAFTEDDCVADPGWLANAARRFGEEPDLDVLDGRTVKPGGRPVHRSAGDAPLYLPANLFVRRARFEAVGGYCEAFYEPESGIYFREDSDLGFSLEAAGARVARDRTVVVTHPEEHARFLDPLRWARRYAMDPLLARRHPERFADRIEVLRLGPFRLRRPFVRACVVYALSLLALGGGALAGAPPVAVTGAAGAAAALLAVWSKWRFDPRRLPLVPVVPFVLLASLAAGGRRARRYSARPGGSDAAMASASRRAMRPE